MYFPLFSSVELLMDKVWLYRPFTANKSVFVDGSIPLKVHRVIALFGIVLHITFIDCPSVTIMVSDGRRIGGALHSTNVQSKYSYYATTVLLNCLHIQNIRNLLYIRMTLIIIITHTKKVNK